MSDIYVNQKADNLRKVFFTIKKKANEIISDYDDVSYLDAPSMPIEAIAESMGIKVLPVKPKEINYLHAILDDSDKENIVIKINNKDSEREQLFSIAHEIGHYVRKKNALLSKANVFKNGNSVKKDDVLGKAENLLNSKAFAARSSPGSYKKVIREIKKEKDAKFIAGYMAEAVSENLGKNVSIDQAYKEWAKALLEGTISKKTTNSRYNEQLILYLTNKLYDEEFADYFAANLLVPVERLLLWKEKFVPAIAKAFKVSWACIRKRKKEIRYELEFLTSKDISSGDKA
jgi:Zn-dependent peptidase ImmA (M78 family)